MAQGRAENQLILRLPVILTLSMLINVVDDDGAAFVITAKTVTTHARATTLLWLERLHESAGKLMLKTRGTELRILKKKIFGL